MHLLLYKMVRSMSKLLPLEADIKGKLSKWTTMSPKMQPGIIRPLHTKPLLLMRWCWILYKCQKSFTQSSTRWREIFFRMWHKVEAVWSSLKTSLIYSTRVTALWALHHSKWDSCLTLALLRFGCMKRKNAPIRSLVVPIDQSFNLKIVQLLI